MFSKIISRRGFFKAAGKTGAAGYLALAGAAFGTLFKPKPVWAANLKTLNSGEAQAMLAMARRLYPHDHLGDQYYQVVVEGIDSEMAGSGELATQIRDGFAQMDQVFGIPFADLSVGNQIGAMKKAEGTPFFSAMLGKTTFYFYNNKNVWPHFGYGGSSWEKGGYINRGFDDVRLPNA